MCGIAGIAKFVEPITVDDVHSVLRMIDAQVHRGPDDWGILVPDTLLPDPALQAAIARGPQHVRSYPGAGMRGGVVFGSRRLAIIDLSEHGRMPMGSADRQTWLTYNGEIYNFRELRSELAGRGHSFDSGTDTEVLLHAFEEWGLDAIPRLRGMFAAAFFRATVNPQVFLAKDRFGIKPLYYHTTDEGMSFASEVRSLIAGGYVPNKRDTTAMLRFLQLGSIPLPLTTVEDVVGLPAGHTASFNVPGTSLRKYWDLRDSLARAERPDAPEAEILRRLTDSVSHHLVSDVPLGIFLSGGVDSSALVALAHRAGHDPIKTVSVAFGEAQFNEAPHARLIAKKFATQHAEVLLDRDEFFAELPRIFSAMDQPTVDGVNVYFVSKAAKKFGLTVVFAGTGADEIFLGYKHLRQAQKVDAFRRTLKALPAAVRHMILNSMARSGGHFSAREKVAYLNHAGEANAYLVFRGLFGPQRIQQLLGITSRELRHLGATIPGWIPLPDAPLVDSFVALDFHHYLQNQLMKDTDAMSMAHSIEVRVPFLDSEVVDYVTSIRASRRGRGNVPKPLLVNALGDDLPRSTWDRPKQGFTFPFGEWLRSKSEELEADTLNAHLFDGALVKEIWTNFRAGAVHWSRPWALSVLAAQSAATVPVAAAAAAPGNTIEVQSSSSVVRPQPRRHNLVRRRAFPQTPGKRVLLLLPDLLDSIGGIQTFNRCLVSALDQVSERQGWELDILVLNDKQRERPQSEYFGNAVSCRGFDRHIKKFSLSAIGSARDAGVAFFGHVNFIPLLPAMMVLAPRLRSVLVVHGIEGWERLPLHKRAGVNLTKQVLTVSGFTRDEMLLHNRIHGPEFTVFPDTLDPLYGGAPDPQPRMRLGLPDGPMVLTVSRLQQTEFYKRVDLVIESLPEILKNVPDAFAVIVGDGGDRPRLQDLAHKLGVADRVRFAGRVSDADLPLYYQACDVFALPSLKEGFGIVFLEAMYYGKPCIGARAAAVPEVIADGTTGLLAAPGDVRSLAEQLTRLLSDPDLAHTMGNHGRERLRANFSFELFRNRLEETISAQLSKVAGVPSA